MNINYICDCGKKRGTINSTNWSRHLDACVKRKKSSSKFGITKFFKPTTAITPKTQGIYVICIIVFSLLNNMIIDQRFDNY